MPPTPPAAGAATALRPGKAYEALAFRLAVAIARALLRHPRLLLDEATSQLDAVNEAALRDTIAKAARTTTVLVVAHRLSTVTMADRIVVLDAGRVRAVGAHAQLLGTDPLYAELAAIQFLVAAD